MSVSIRTTVKNVDSQARYFDFLPPHGVTLQAGQEFSFPGTLVDATRRRGSGPAREKLVQAMDYAIDTAEWLQVLATPSVAVTDGTTGTAYSLSMNNGVLTASDTAHTDPEAAIAVGPYTP